MSFKKSLKDNSQKVQKSLTKNWKKTVLFSSAFLAVGGAGVAIGSKVADHQEHGDRMSRSYDKLDSSKSYGAPQFKKGMGHGSYQYDKQNVMTYDEWKTAVENSSLSSSDKKTFLAALEKSKDKITKASDLSTQLDKLYTDNLEKLDKELETLVSKNSSLWQKVDDADELRSLSGLDLDDLTDLKQSINESSLSSSEKSTLQADLDSIKKLKEQYSTAYATYVEKSAELEKELETAQKAVTTSLKDNKVTNSMISEVVGRPSMSFDWDDKDDDNDSDTDED
ncbi:hypothetical protein AALA56_04305 [Streptococcus hyointestinalis]|uniref:hypothetical protein n=1 Tax=Streptococcus hyointestinalis TaxID=1337 RepID=UPI0035178121